jgi:2-phosphosulfolactate phosphatase
MEPTTIEILFAPAEFALLPQRDLGGSVCVVFDVLRATSSIVTALANGAAGVRPVAEIQEALRWRKQDPRILLAGERDGLKIGPDLTDGLLFDLGNSPREFTPDAVRGRHIVMTTTNGTRALEACSKASIVLASSFLNLRSTVEFLQANPPRHLLAVCSGTFEETALEDVLAAGALCDRLGTAGLEFRGGDSVLMARRLFQQSQGDLAAAISSSRNGRRLLSRPELGDDVRFCAQLDPFNLVVRLDKDGWLRANEPAPVG